MLSPLLNFDSFAKTVSSRAVFMILALTFAFIHWGMFLSIDSLYWDDWGLLTSDENYIRQIFQFTGFKLLGTFHAWFSPLGIAAYKILTLCCVAFMSVSVFLIIRHYGFDAAQAAAVTALFIATPFYAAKIAAINVPGTLSAAIFFGAWLLLLKDLQKPRLHQRIFALALFSIAFYFPSSLAFFALPALSIAWHAFGASNDWSQRFLMLSKRTDFLILPFMQFAVFRVFFFKPDASIAGEYQKFGIRTSRLQEALDRIQADFLIDMPWVVKAVLLILPMVILLRLLKNPSRTQNYDVGVTDSCFVIGLSACFFALLPYLAVGRLPVFSDWNSRYHLFLPFGFALVCLSICRYIAAYTGSKSLGVCAFVAILLLSAWSSVSSYREYSDDWRKQQQVMTGMQKLSFVNPLDNIVFVDSVHYAKRRHLRYNEYTQMMMRAQPTWQGMAISYSRLNATGAGSLKNYLSVLGGIENIQANPTLYALPSHWRWNDSCVILKIHELGGRVLIESVRSSSITVQPCSIAP